MKSLLLVCLIVISCHAFAQVKVLSSLAEVVTVSGAESPLKKNWMEMTGVTVDYRYNKLYLTDGNEEEGAQVQIMSIRPFAKLGLIPEATKIILNQSDYFLVYQPPSNKRSLELTRDEAVRYQVRRRLKPQEIISYYIGSGLLPIEETCFDLSINQWLGGVGIDLKVKEGNQFPKEQFAQSCWSDGTVLYSKYISNNRFLWVGSDPENVLHKFKREIADGELTLLGRKNKAVIPSYAEIKDQRFEISLLDVTGRKFQVVSGTVKDASIFRHVTFAGFSKDYESAYYAVVNFGRRWYNVYGQQVYKLSYVSNQWVLKEVDVSKLVEVYEQTHKRPLAIQWVIE